jgi:hypothetical protein
MLNLHWVADKKKKEKKRKKGDRFIFRFFSGPALLPILNTAPNDRFDFVCKSIIPG